MKRNILGYSILAIYTLLTFSVYSCSDDEDVVKVKEPTINEGKADKILNSAITEWNVSMEEVTIRMKNYKLVTSQNEDFLMYSDKEYASFISYKFFNDSLYSTLVLMPPMSENSDLKNVLKEYSFVGKLEDVDVYLNESENSMVCTSEIVEDSVTYLAVGFTPVEMDSLIISTLYPAFGVVNGYKWIDLGLSVKWATCNIGASSPEKDGDRIAWGELYGKSNFDDENSVTFGEEMEDFAGNPQYDAARSRWGDNWRLPSKSECQELVDRCTWVWTSLNGRSGCKVIGPNGNSIFLSAAGWRSREKTYGYGTHCSYWSSTPYEVLASQLDAWYHNEKLTVEVNGRSRDSGRNIRPVIE